jgi:hypothetical protein
VLLAAVCVVAIATPLPVVLRAEDAQTMRRAELLRQMRELARETKLEFADGGRQPVLVENPVFRYDDQPRRFIDATMWVWTDEGRPVAFQKIEASIDVVTNAPKWGYCFASLAEVPLRAQWTRRAAFRSTEAGVSFRPVPGAPQVAGLSAQRRQQARALAREFSARILLNPQTDSTEEMRLLSAPIFEYDDPDTELFRGAVFGFATSGRNPDLLMAFEVRATPAGAEWQYAPARMTIGGVTVKQRDKTVWEVPFIEPRPKDFATWTFFYEPRKPLSGEEGP